MKKDFEHIEELIAKFLAGEATSAEQIALEAWRAESTLNELHFKQSNELFSKVNNFHTPVEVDINAAWQRLDSRITSEAKIIPVNRHIITLRVAASLLLLVALGFLVNWFFDQPAAPELALVTNETTLAQTLPDGSKVVINKNSELIFVESKNGERRVKLKGEAFFEVIHNTEKPFVIDVNGLMVKDIGTAFNVKEDALKHTVEVYVESGEVQLYTKEKEGVLLVKGDRGIYDREKGSFTKTEIAPSENTGSYKSKIFEFTETPLGEVIAQLNSVYGSDIRLADPTLANDPLSVVFNNENVDMIIGIIAETLDLSVEKKDGVVFLRRKNTSK